MERLQRVSAQRRDGYLFNYKTHVDAHHMGCGYHEQEKCSDELKRDIRRHIGLLSLAAQRRMSERMPPGTGAHDPGRCGI